MVEIESKKLERYICLFIAVLCDIGFAIVIVHGLLYSSNLGWHLIYGVSLIALGIPGIFFTSVSWIEFNLVHGWLKLK